MIRILRHQIMNNPDRSPPMKLRRSKFANFDAGIVLKYHYLGESIRHISELIRKNEGITISKSQVQRIIAEKGGKKEGNSEGEKSTSSEK